MGQHRNDLSAEGDGRAGEHDNDLDGDLASDATHFEWDFPSPRSSGHAPTRPPVDRSQPVGGGKSSSTAGAEPRSGRVVEGETLTTSSATAHQMLDAALDRWWSEGVLPSQRQLRAGLELLVSGVELPEAHGTLLLRAALFHGRGVQTAMRFQSDPERVGMVVSEMVLAGRAPESLEPLEALVQTRPGADWAVFLRRQLEQASIAGDLQQRERARQALSYVYRHEHVVHPLATDRAYDLVTAPESWYTPVVMMRRLLLVALAVVMGSYVAWYRMQVAPPRAMAPVPAGTYPVYDGDVASVTQVSTDGFYVDRFEVTNEAYARCVERGVCARPVANDSATRPSYFITPEFSAHPVVNVSYSQAVTFCNWLGKRLPTATEWQIAALGPAQSVPLTYPWGMEYDRQLANSAATAIGDTVAGGFFRPSGDSGHGVSDLAGNVAEWTASVPERLSGVRVVKGGSYRSPADELALYATELVEEDAAHPWVGFRCVREVGTVD